ncbi:hypothetical protein D3C80_1718310 [compost metagenome]
MKRQKRVVLSPPAQLGISLFNNRCRRELILAQPLFLQCLIAYCHIMQLICDLQLGSKAHKIVLRKALRALRQRVKRMSGQYRLLR